MLRPLFCTTALLSFFSFQRPIEAAPVIAPGGIVNAASHVAAPIVAYPRSLLRFVLDDPDYGKGRRKLHEGESRNG
jgi:hypothetical protein